MKHIYKLKDGSSVPGVTTVIGQLDKPGLLDWSWKLGKQGKDWREERDSAGDIGTLVHELAMKYLTQEQVDLTTYSDVVVNCFYKFHNWWRKEIAPDVGIVEHPFVSEKYRFGGTPDIFIVIKGRLIDIKTSGGIYETMWIQLAGYDILLREHGYKPKEYQIVWIPKDDRFDDPIRTDLRKEKEIFKHLLKIYQLRNRD